MKECTKPLLCGAHYDRETTTNALRPQILYDIVLSAQHFLQVNFFPSITLITCAEVESIQGKFQKTFISEEPP